MRRIGPRPGRLTPEELLEPIATLKGVARGLVEHALDAHGLSYYASANLGAEMIHTAIYMGEGMVGYVSRAPGTEDLWTMLILPYQTPDAPEPAPRTRAVRLH